jgi:steroid delta-isomerase-like uncharacterized protein
MKHLLALLAISSVLLSSCMKKDTGASESSLKGDSTKLKNIEGYRAVNDMFNSGKYDSLDKYIDANIADHQMMPGQKPGLAGLKEDMTNFRAAFPELKFTINEIMADGDKVWALSTMSGTHSGAPFMGMPANGKSFSAQGVDIVRITNGKAVEHWGFYDHMKMMTDLGMPMGAPPAGDGKMIPPPDMKKGK